LGLIGTNNEKPLQIKNIRKALDVDKRELNSDVSHMLGKQHTKGSNSNI
jgi:hypothetical protein